MSTFSFSSLGASSGQEVAWDDRWLGQWLRVRILSLFDTH
jgi:hypothetical protein